MAEDHAGEMLLLLGWYQLAATIMVPLDLARTETYEDPTIIDPAAGSVLVQSLVLGAIQIAISVSCNAAIALSAGAIALFLSTRPIWMRGQRYLMGTVLAGLAVRMVFEAKRA